MSRSHHAKEKKGVKLLPASNRAGWEDKNPLRWGHEKSRVKVRRWMRKPAP